MVVQGRQRRGARVVRCVVNPALGAGGLLDERDGGAVLGGGVGGGRRGFEWLGLEELTQEGSESSWYYQVEEGEDAETHGSYGIFILHAF